MLSTVSGLDWDYMEKWAIVLGVEQILKRAKNNE